ncbi:MAG: Ku protein [Burkholderiales bacterium]|nr:Ku protein [Burkholderiales bacterium]
MARAIWKGAISFGLVSIPVAVLPGSSDNQLDLDLLDRRDFAPVGYQRINKRTGEAVKPADIVKGYQYAKGRYVVVSDEDFRQANVRATQTIDIHAFVAAADVPGHYFERPYYLEPDRGGAKGYALLREALARSDKVGIGSVVLHTRQHLALLIPIDELLLLNTLRYAAEIRPHAKLKLPERNLRRLGVSAKEVAMAQRLVEEMTEDWDPRRYRDTYRDDLVERIEAKVKAGKTREIMAPTETAAARKSAQVIDLMALLKRSLNERDRNVSGKAKPTRARARPAKRSRKRA